MEIKNAAAVYFSPGGTTGLAARTVAAALGECKEYNFTSRAEPVTLGADCAAVFAAPVFGGRIPGVFADFLASVKGEGTPAVVLAVYGNRDYEDALLELADAVKARGFRVVAAGAFIARHSIVTEIAAGRPDTADRAAMAAFAGKVRDKLAAGDFSEPHIPGARPYRKYGGVPMHPGANRQRCVKCGKCARECPAGAIPTDAPFKTDNDKCITCMHCVFTCPNYARGLNPVMLAATRTKLKKACTVRREPEMFL